MFCKTVVVSIPPPTQEHCRWIIFATHLGIFFWYGSFQHSSYNLHQWQICLLFVCLFICLFVLLCFYIMSKNHFRHCCKSHQVPKWFFWVSKHLLKTDSTWLFVHSAKGVTRFYLLPASLDYFVDLILFSGIISLQIKKTN